MLVRSLSHTFNSVTLNAVRSTLGGALILAWVLSTGGLTTLTAMSGRAFILLAISVLLAVWLGDTVFFESTRDLGLAPGMNGSDWYSPIRPVVHGFFLVKTLQTKLGGGAV